MSRLTKLKKRAQWRSVRQPAKAMSSGSFGSLAAEPSQLYEENAAEASTVSPEDLLPALRDVAAAITEAFDDLKCELDGEE